MIDVGTPSQIAVAVLTKLSADEWNVPQMTTVGGGAGLGVGLLGAGAAHRGDISGLLRLHYQRPQLEQSRTELKNLLSQVKKQQPATKSFTSRKLTNMLLQNKGQIPPEAYYVARKGSEEGFSGLARNSKLMRLFKKRLVRGGGIRAGFGLGAGVGAGLLAAVGSGKFD